MCVCGHYWDVLLGAALFTEWGSKIGQRGKGARLDEIEASASPMGSSGACGPSEMFWVKARCQAFTCSRLTPSMWMGHLRRAPKGKAVSFTQGPCLAGNGLGDQGWGQRWELGWVCLGGAISKYCSQLPSKSEPSFWAGIRTQSTDRERCVFSSWHRVWAGDWPCPGNRAEVGVQHQASALGELACFQSPPRPVQAALLLSGTCASPAQLPQPPSPGWCRPTDPQGGPSQPSDKC